MADTAVPAVTDTEPRTWTLRLDGIGRPPTTNAVHKLHHFAATGARAPWRDLTTVLCRRHRLPKGLPAITVTAQATYPDRRALPDCDGIAPAVKGALDGLVNARVIPDDKPPFVQAVTYLAPIVTPGEGPALTLTITEAT